MEWLTKIPKWQQIAAKRLLESDDLNDAAIFELALLCRKEANNEPHDIDDSILDWSFDALNSDNSEEIHLCSISEVTGVNKLAPKEPLDFGKSNVAVVYGSNGSGKSGYVRLLKHICGVRNCVRDHLHKNVFSTEDIAQEAKVSFLKGSTSREYKWIGSGVCDDLCAVSIFDISFGRVFMGSGDEVSYEPPFLSLFSRLINVCDRVCVKIDEDINALKLKMPSIPDYCIDSAGAVWLKKLSAKTTIDAIESYCSFTTENKTELQKLEKRTKETSPADKATQFRSKKNYANSLIIDLQKYISQLSDENCKRLIASKKKLTIKKSADEAVANNVFSSEKLKGIGSDVWKELWNAALKYSEELAYSGHEFPYIQDASVCVLCHQPLLEEAKQRFTSFESHIKGETQKQVTEAEREVKQATEALPDLPSSDELKTKIDAAGIESKDIVKGLNDILTALQDRKLKVLSLDSEDVLGTASQSLELIEKIKEISQGYEDSAKKYEEDATKDNHVEINKKIKDLLAKQWLADNKTAIQEEVRRLQEVDQLQKAKKKTNSQKLSTEKGKLADVYITDDFVQRFNNELEELRASKIKVKLDKSEVSKGKVLHVLQLDGADHNPNEILSEGESRIVSIAAFLADATARNYPAPFVFDDPISSLDQNYEEAVVERLCSIASERQVIIFTHRLSLLSMVQDCAKKLEPKIICIRKEPWGTGEPGYTSLQDQKPSKALNTLIDKELPEAKAQFEKGGYDAYKTKAKSLCSEFRILLERMVEYELMSDIVQRCRRAIHTKNKIKNLAKISEADCQCFDALMTKYSRYEHSQSPEAPVQLPEPNELAKDFNKLKIWQKEFSNRGC